jgi:hypothetical protein
MQGDQRQFARAHVLRRGRIVFARGHSSVDCVVLDLSSGGARLKVDAWLGLPDRFELRIEKGLVREAVVRHRTPDATGVEFIDPAAAA